MKKITVALGIGMLFLLVWALHAYVEEMPEGAVAATTAPVEQAAQR